MKFVTVTKDGMQFDLHDENQLDAFLSEGWQRVGSSTIKATDAAVEVVEKPAAAPAVSVTKEDLNKMSYPDMLNLAKELGIEIPRNHKKFGEVKQLLLDAIEV